MKNEALENAKATAMAKIKAWALVQSAAKAKKDAAKAASNAPLAQLYFTAEVRASVHRQRHEGALDAISRWERHEAERIAWEQRCAR